MSFRTTRKSMPAYPTGESSSASFTGNTDRVTDLKYRGIKRLPNLKLTEIRCLELLQMSEPSTGALLMASRRLVQTLGVLETDLDSFIPISYVSAHLCNDARTGLDRRYSVYGPVLVIQSGHSDLAA